MAKFTDTEGQDWTLRMGLYEMEEIRDRTGIDFIAQTEDDAEEVEQEFTDDLSSLLEILWIGVRDQAKDRDMTEDEVKKRFSYGPLNAQVEAWRKAMDEWVEGPGGGSGKNAITGSESG